MGFHYNEYRAYCMGKHILAALILTLGLIGLEGCAPPMSGNASTQSIPSLSRNVNLQNFPNDPAFWQADNAMLWDQLQHVPLAQLQGAITQSNDPNHTAWIKLAAISKQYSTSTTQLTAQLISWRAANGSHPGNSLFPGDSTLTALQNTPPPRHIALLLPLQGPLGASGQMVRDGFLNGYYGGQSAGQQTISFYDTGKNPNVGALYQQALREGADSVIGPLTKDNVQDLLHQGGFSIPTLALNYTDTWGSLPSNFYEFGLSVQDETQQLADKARQAGRSSAIIIAPQTEWGQRNAKSLTSRWTSLGGSVSDTFYFTDQTDLNQGIANLMHVDVKADRAKMKTANNKNALEQQRRQDFNVIFLLAPPEAARQIVPMLKYYYANNIPIYATSIVYAGNPSPQDSDLNGVIFSDIPWVFSANNRSNRLYAVGRDAYLLINQIPRMRQLPNFPLYGATGALTLTPQQQIYRRVAWVQMHDGHP